MKRRTFLQVVAGLAGSLIPALRADNVGENLISNGSFTAVVDDAAWAVGTDSGTITTLWSNGVFISNTPLGDDWRSFEVITTSSESYYNNVHPYVEADTEYEIKLIK